MPLAGPPPPDESNDLMSAPLAAAAADAPVGEEAGLSPAMVARPPGLWLAGGGGSGLRGELAPDAAAAAAAANGEAAFDDEPAVGEAAGFEGVCGVVTDT